ncbi:AAA family ATPase [Phycisphaera mikurensis]|nr:AAA family ATPase [Phycisphaera mikurensis]MBB6443231.1 flagellar biosynthesis protein FlhG [Phycisphaera mikurensis]
MVDRLAGEAKAHPPTGEAAARTSSPRRRARTVAVASGKGGVGKTTLVVSLAAELVRRGRRVLVLDADFGTANVDVACGLTPEATLADVLAGTHRLPEIALRTPAGFHLLPGASGLTGAGDLPAEHLGDLFKGMDRLEAANDLILIDVGAGVGPVVQAFCAAAARLLVVTTPDPTAVTDAYALLKTLALSDDAQHARVVVNGVRDATEAGEVHDRLESACRHFLGFSPSLAGYVPDDPAVAAAVRARTPLLQEAAATPAGWQMARLAATLDSRGASQRPVEAAPDRGRGFLRRLLRIG